ncbi:efflux RND transporter periplasmic adaptor subunit [Planctomicrobium sp. SH661]|uniref:efflux RND transporter periplasmic adaptor subunit n=1 Tax=Planctomicrobium sp. SH661 TaxID=3448124 RepID=UPI003F5B028C
MPRFSFKTIAVAGVILGLAVAASFRIYTFQGHPAQHTVEKKNSAEEDLHSPQAVEQAETSSEDSLMEPIEFPEKLWPAAGIVVSPVKLEPLSEDFRVTGKITLNEERLAHVFPLVEGRVEAVHVQLGQRVKKGDPLVVIQSKEVGARMLQLFQDRLRLSFAETKNEWTKNVGANTLALIEEIRAGAEIEEIEKKFKARPMGNYREKLMTAYVALYKARIHLDRLSPLSKEGAVAGRQVVEAQSDLDASKAVLESLLEQVSQDVRQDIQLSDQAVEEARASATIAEANLRILGYTNDDLNRIDPVQQGDTLAHYVITAPFDGTVISKDVVLMERVGPDRQILTIADLSSVWVTGDIFESQLPLLAQLRDKTVDVSSNTFPQKSLPARIFYTGDVVEEATRTLALRAVAENGDGLLKPGMFVTVKLPGLQLSNVLQVPATAVQDHEGKSFVFVQTGDAKFQRKDVTVGRRNRESVEVLEGIGISDRIVTQGGFALKSKMLAGLLEE